MKDLPGIIINGQKVSWSFIQFVRNKKLGGDWDQTINAFLVARKSTDIIKYVQTGFKPDKDGKLYSLLPSKEMNDGKMESIRQWWEGLYKPSTKNDKGMMSLKEIFSALSK
jgi:hypothetical protein